MSCNRHHLMWIRDRLIKVYHENPNMDYICKLNQIISEEPRFDCWPYTSKCELYDEYDIKLNSNFSDGTPVAIYEEIAQQCQKSD